MGQVEDLVLTASAGWKINHTESEDESLPSNFFLYTICGNGPHIRTGSEFTYEMRMRSSMYSLKENSRDLLQEAIKAFAMPKDAMPSIFTIQNMDFCIMEGELRFRNRWFFLEAVDVNLSDLPFDVLPF